MTIRTSIDDLFEEYKHNLSRLIQHPSVLDERGQKPFGKPIQDALEEMMAIAEELGFKTFIDPKGYYGYAEMGEGETMFGILGHLDVVPVGDLAKWDTNPFELHEIDGKLIGRGTSDDKGPMLAAMYSLKLLLDRKETLNQRVRFIFGTDEESLWRCMKAYVEHEELPSLGFTPDSGFPLTYAEKGLIEYTLTLNEPAGFKLVGGDALNAVPSSAVIDFDPKVVEALNALDYKFTQSEDGITVVGKGMHAKDADKGENAIVYAAHALHKAGKRTALIDFIVESCLDANGKLLYGDVQDEVSGKLMLNVGTAKIEGDSQTIGIDIRFPVTYPKERVDEKMYAAGQAKGLDVSEFDYLRSIYLEKDSDYIRTLMAAYRKITHDTVSEPITSGGATYARAMENIVAFGPKLVDAPSTEHQPNEYIVIENMKVAMEVYAEAFLALVIA